MKILLIEDEEPLAASILLYLTSKDCSCELVKTYQTALDKIESYHYDCILLDLTLPGGNGFELLKPQSNKRKN